jgi:hypothetical protein
LAIDAEHYFRRAYTIATATLAPDHQFVATSARTFTISAGPLVQLSSPTRKRWTSENVSKVSDRATIVQCPPVVAQQFVR